MAALVCLAIAASLAGEPLSTLSRKFLETGGPGAREALERFASGHKTRPEGALALLSLGIGDYQEQRYRLAAEELAAAAERLSDLADYAVYYQALAWGAENNHAGAARLLAGFEGRFPSSPLAGAAFRQRVESLSLSSQAPQALALLTDPQNAAEWILSGEVAERAGEKARAAQAYQRAYFEHPTSAQAPRALEATRALRAALGTRYPAPSPALRLGRADRLLAAKQYRTARNEFRSLAASLQGLAREQSVVRLSACDYHLRLDTRAYKALHGLRLTQPEAAAERLYYLAACARRLNRGEEFVRLVDQLGHEHRASAWHEEALLAAGNYFLLENEPERYLGYYRRLLELFPQGRHAAVAHWKLAWGAYRDKAAPEEARRLLEQHIRLFPETGEATAAVYWIGRLAETASQWIAARALYTRLATAYPHYYHALLARERLEQLPPAPSGPAPPEVGRVMAALKAPAAPPAREAGREAAALLGRVRLLDDLGLAEQAQRELRFRAESPALAYHASLELAQKAADAGRTHQAVRHLKRYTPGYLAFPIESLPRQYWELLFPLPWRPEIESYSRMREVDPFLVAGLIRQESEFNPGAISPARARGLMQIMLPTGRQLGRTLGMRSLSANQLYVPDTSLRLGILHLRRVLDQYDGRIERVLAGYNAGEHRVDKWMAQYQGGDAAEFVESIPFTETRGYVQAVLRNAALYRELYGR